MQPVQVNLVTSWIDGSSIYGPSTSWSDSLRSFSGGRLVSGSEWNMPSRARGPSFMWSAADPSTGDHGPQGLYGESRDRTDLLAERMFTSWRFGCFCDGLLRCQVGTSCRSVLKNSTLNIYNRSYLYLSVSVLGTIQSVTKLLPVCCCCSVGSAVWSVFTKTGEHLLLKRRANFNIINGTLFFFYPLTGLRWLRI